MKGCSFVIWCFLYSCQYSKVFIYKLFIVIDFIIDFLFIVFFGNIFFNIFLGLESNYGEYSKFEWSWIIDFFLFDEFKKIFLEI